MMKTTLPPGISKQTLDEALDGFAGVVGKKSVFKGEDIVSYRDPYAIVDDDYFEASAAIAPSSVEEVQACIKVANDLGIPLWTISCGKNLAYGGAAPRLPGSVILDLKRMNRIIEVNEKFGYALVEPGVSYFDLYEYLQKHNIKLWLDVPSPGWGSVLGNTLERGVGYTPYGDHFMMQCGMEVVMADGDIVRTGMGALPGNNTWQLFKYGFGPSHDGLFTQSNYGVVTKLGIWLMPEPPGYRPYMITFEKEEDIEQIVEIMRPLKINMVIQNAASIVSLLLEAAIKATRSQYYNGDGALPPSVQKKIMADQKIGMWNFYGAQYGPQNVMDASWSVIQDAFSKIPGAKFYFKEDRPGDAAMDYRSKTMAGIPNLTEFSFVNWLPGAGHIDFSPVSPTTGQDAVKQYEMIRDRSADFNYDYLGMFIVGWREMHHIFTLVFDRINPQRKKQAEELFDVLIREAAEAGYGEYRTHLAYMDQIANSYNWNDNSLMRLNEKIKDALDPKGILAAGKQGIWPKHLRDKKP